MRSIRLHTTNEHARGNRGQRRIAGGETLRALAYSSSLLMRAIRAAVALAVDSMRVDVRKRGAETPAPAAIGLRFGRLATFVAKRPTAAQQACWLPVLCSSAVRS